MRARHDGFTPEKRKRFFAVLGTTGCVSDAARAARISTTTVDRWRRKDARFARLFETAIDKAAAQIELLAWERGVTGIEEPVYHYGKFSHMRVKRSDAIFRMILMASDKEKYGRMGAVARQQGQVPRVATNAEVRVSLLKAFKAYGARITAEEDAELEEARRQGIGEDFEPPESEE